MKSKQKFSTSSYWYDFDAGDLALDFANTLDWHASAHPIETITSYGDLLQWAVVGGLIDESTAANLAEAAKRSPEQASGVLADAINLREAIYRIFNAAAAGEAVPQQDVATLNQSYQQAAQHYHMVLEPQGVRWEWEIKPGLLDAMLWPVARAAAQLLTSPDLEKVGQCQDDRGCGWLFIDTSRNHSRRWCSMESCGNRAKAQRHYGRSKNKKSERII